MTDHAQGAAQALEDAAALGIALSRLKSIQELPSRLQQFQDIRKDRASAVQIFSNAAQDEAEKIKELAKPYVRGPMPSKPPISTEETQLHIKKDEFYTKNFQQT